MSNGIILGEDEIKLVPCHSLPFDWKDIESEKAGVGDCKKSYTKEKT